ncbi:MAG: hypothetical protein HRT61_10260 [Ekhidna sp.]|nr:hypothetical protein [Ekhidna sp.]
MSSFSEALNSALDATQNSDRSLICAAVIEIVFKTETVRLWSGTGGLITPDGERWVGWSNGDPDNPQSFIDVPDISDPRDGNSPLYEFTLGYIDEESYQRLKSDADEANDAVLNVGNVYLEGNSTRALTPPGNKERLRIVGGASFSEKRTLMEDGSHKLQYSVSVKAKNVNGGRSRVSFSTFTDTTHKFRSSTLFGVQNDDYAQFIARYAGGITLTI